MKNLAPSTESKDLISQEGVYREVFNMNTALAHTGTTASTSVLTYTLPANVLGVNGKLIIDFFLSWTNSANTKSFRLKINGTTVLLRAVTTGTFSRSNYRLQNRNNIALQLGMDSASSLAVGPGTGASNVAPTTLAFDTSQAITISMEITLATATETASIESFNVAYINNS